MNYFSPFFFFFFLVCKNDDNIAFSLGSYPELPHIPQVWNQYNVKQRKKTTQKRISLLDRLIT